MPIAAESGLKDRNRTEFHDCRKYSGKSVMSFLDPEEIEPAPAPPPPLIESALPPDFQADISLQTPITFSSDVGDLLTAQLMHHYVGAQDRILQRSNPHRSYLATALVDWLPGWPLQRGF